MKTIMTHMALIHFSFFLWCLVYYVFPPLLYFYSVVLCMMCPLYLMYALYRTQAKQEGNGPIIPASTRAMRNRLVVLYDLNYPNRYITPNDLGGHLTSDLKSATLITLVSMCILPLMASEALTASKQPPRSFDL